jgi:hypothetical protein
VPGGSILVGRVTHTYQSRRRLTRSNEPRVPVGGVIGPQADQQPQPAGVRRGHQPVEAGEVPNTEPTTQRPVMS